MNKKLIKTIASITCGLGIVASIPFITSCNTQEPKEQEFTVMYNNSLTGNSYQLSFVAGSATEDQGVGPYTHLFSVIDNNKNPIKINDLTWLFFDASTGKKINWLSIKKDYTDEYSGILVCDATNLPATTSEMTRHSIRIQAQNSSSYGRLNNPLSISLTQPEITSINVSTDIKQIEIDPFSQGQFEQQSIKAVVLPWQASQSVDWTLEFDNQTAPKWLHIKPFNNAYELCWDATTEAKTSGEHNVKLTAKSGSVTSNEISFFLKIKSVNIIPEIYLNINDTRCYGVREDLRDEWITSLKNDGYDEIEIPDFVTSLPYGAFSSANPSFITEKWNFVKKLSFEKNSELTSIDKFTLSGEETPQPFEIYDFSNCTELTTIDNCLNNDVISKLYLPASIKSIDDYAFTQTEISEIWFTDIPTVYTEWTTQAFGNIVDDGQIHYIHFMNGQPEGYQDFINYLHEKCGLSDKWQAATN